MIEERRKNDIIFIPIGCTENHGMHLPSAADTLFVSQILEGVPRYTAKRDGAPCPLSLPPLNFGAHPYHHMGMPGTAIVRADIAREMLIDVMLGLWNDGFRKQIFINNHGHLWMLEATIQQFQKRYHLLGIFRVLDWHRGVETGYHVLDYFLKQWDRFKHVPLGVLAHSTHVRGGGRFENGVEYPRAAVTLATKLPAADCERLALGYVHPANIKVTEWQGREDEGVLCVPKAGEMLYRFREE